MRRQMSGFSLLEMAVVFLVLALLATVFVPLASGLLDTQRANIEMDELTAIYTAVVGDPKSNTFGYLGDVGDYPSSLIYLVQSPGLTGWNGPYINEARLENSILYDQFGSALEYFQPAVPTVPAVLDQLALISKGTDRNSTNNPANPNQSISFGGVLPSDPSYVNGSGNANNIVYPGFIDNSSVLNYQSLGTVNFNLYDFDEAAANSGRMPACPGLYDIVITSVPRGTNQAYITYNPGGATVDLVQGLYTVKVSVAGSRYPIWQEQINVIPGTVMTRDYTLPGVNSSLFATLTLTLNNNTANKFQLYENGISNGAQINNNSSVTRTVHRCSRLLVLNTMSVIGFDSFIMPNFATSKTYFTIAPTYDTLTVSNDGVPSKTVAIYDEGLLVGIVGGEGNQRVKVFTLKDGDTITVRNENNVQVAGSPFVLAPNTTKNY